MPKATRPPRVSSASSLRAPPSNDPTLAASAAVPPDPTPPALSALASVDESGAKRGAELHSMLEEDERLSAEYTGELGRLQRALASQTLATTAMVKYLEAEVRRKDLMVRRLGAQRTDLAATHASDLARMGQQFSNTCQYMERIFLSKEAAVLDKNAALEARIKELAPFDALRTQLATELEQTKTLIFSNERKHKLDLDQLEHRFLQARDGLQREAANRIAESRGKYKLEVAGELELESAEVRRENTDLRLRLRQHEGTSDRLQKTAATLTARIKTLRRELELAQEQQAEYSRTIGATRGGVERLTDRVAVLEEQWVSSLREKEENAHARAIREAEEVAPIQARLEAARENAEELDRVNRSLRRRARNALRQRKDTERFFFSAIKETRENLERKRAIQKKERDLLQQAQLRELTLPPSMRTKLPVIVGAESNPYPPSLYSSNPPTLAVGDLTLEDREKVLRLLYAKISHTPSGLTISLPPHSFDIQLTAPATAHTRSNILSLPPTPHRHPQSQPSLSPSDSQREFTPTPSVPQLLSGDGDDVGRADPDMTFLTNFDADGAGSEDDDDDDDDDEESQRQEAEARYEAERKRKKHQSGRPQSALDEAD